MNGKERGLGEWLRPRIAYALAVLCAPLLVIGVAILIPLWFCICMVNAIRAKPMDWWNDGVRR